MNPFLGQIMLFAGNFAPRGWAFCKGQLLPIAQNTALFSILGTTYGGDGRTTFGLPDLQGRKAISQGHGPGLPTYALGQKGGNPTTVLLAQNLPAAQVFIPCSADQGDFPEAENAVMAVPDDDSLIYSATSNGTMQAGRLVGAQNTSFSNQAPYETLNYIIALQGTFPSRS